MNDIEYEVCLKRIEELEKRIDALLVIEKQNAVMRKALETTQDSARMAVLAVDIRMTLNPKKAVGIFNSLFPEVAKVLAQVGEA